MTQVLPFPQGAATQATSTDHSTAGPVVDDWIQKAFFIPEGMGKLISGDGERRARLAWVAELLSTRKTDALHRFIPLSAKRIEKTITSHAWKAARHFFSDHWEVDHHFVPEEKCKGYRWKHEWRVPCEWVQFYCPRFNQRLMRLDAQSRAEYGEVEQNLEKDLHRLSSSITDAKSFVENLPPKPGCNQAHRQSYHRYCLDRLRHREFGVIHRPSGTRMFHFATNLPREIRKTLLVDGHLPVCEVDLSSSQPYFLAALCPEIQGLREAVENGETYHRANEKLASPLDFDDPHQYSRFKELFLMVLFSRPAENGYEWSEQGVYEKVSDAMEASYPGITAFKAQYARNHGNNSLAHELQRQESDVFIDDVLPLLQEAGMFSVPIHDGFLCLESEAERIRGILENRLEKATGITPNVKAAPK